MYSREKNVQTSEIQYMLANRKGSLLVHWLTNYVPSTNLNGVWFISAYDLRRDSIHHGEEGMMSRV